LLQGLPSETKAYEPWRRHSKRTPCSRHLASAVVRARLGCTATPAARALRFALAAGNPPFSDDGARALAAALKDNTALTTLTGLGSAYPTNVTEFIKMFDSLTEHGILVNEQKANV
jgi:hypothetical protein